MDIICCVAGFGLQSNNRSKQMSARTRNFRLIFLLAFYLLLFCAKSVDSEDSSRLVVAFHSEEGFLTGRQNVTDLASKLRGLKQILPALATVPASDDGNNMDSISSLILAEHRTRRPDILYKLKRYEGGWNITNKHYWASVGFTGVPGFILAVVWFTVFGLVFFVHYCCSRRIKGQQQGLQIIHWSSLLLIILFTCAALVGCILLSLGQDKFHHEISHTLDFVVKQSHFIIENLRNVTEYLADARTMNVAQIIIPEDEQQQIVELNEKLAMVTNKFEKKTINDADRIQRALDALRDSLIVVAGVMLLLAILGLLSVVLGFRHIVCALVIIGWLLVAVTFILCGVFIVLNNAIADTCVAMQEWVVHPNAYSNLDHILSCVNQSTTNQTFYRSKQVTSDLVNLVNQVISNVANTNVPPTDSTTYYNQSGPLIPELCNPFDLMFNNQQCSQHEVNFTSAAQVWNNYICTVSDGICITPGRVTPYLYAQLVAVVNLSYGLDHFTPFLLDLIDCKFVRETFTAIVHSSCPCLQLHSKWVYIGLALVSVGVMLSLIFWIIYMQQQRHHKDECHTHFENKSIDNHS